MKKAKLMSLIERQDGDLASLYSKRTKTHRPPTLLKLDELFVWRLRLLVAATKSGCLGALFHKRLYLSNYILAVKITEVVVSAALDDKEIRTAPPIAFLNQDF